MNPSLDGLREKRLWTRTWDALVDANPVLAKELLVTARTPMFVGSVVLAPLLLGTFVLLVRSGMSHSLDPVTGRQLFPVYFTGLAMALGTVGAALGSTVIVQEREAGALEALKFSLLSPSRIVLGKFAAVVLAEGVVVACTLPLLAFVVALGDVSVGETAVAMSIALACGVMTASLGVAASARAANARRSLLVSLVGASAVGIGVCIWLVAGSELTHSYRAFGVAGGYFEAPLDGTYLALLCVIPTYALPTLLWLGYSVATSGLMDRSEDRSLPVKRWAVRTLSFGMIALFVCASAAGTQQRGPIAGASMIATALLAAALLFTFVDEPLRPTRRMQHQPRSLLVRALYPRCLAPSVFFTLVASAIVLVSIPVLAGAPASLELDALWAVACLSALGGFMGWVAARRGAARARRVGAFALACLPLLVAFLRDDSRGPTWVDGICPLWLDPNHGADAQGVLVGSVVVWAAAAFVCLGAMLRAVQLRPATPGAIDAVHPTSS
jgi:ABC-type transport system involved in multi-copper enzyme maturation permease subunit